MKIFWSLDQAGEPRMEKEVAFYSDGTFGR
jgi:hypothetical protein